ncbi:MAG: allantoate amidohydrolase [Hyphomicrobiales bacterium]|nr:allantoate amidohydrolase [Hyphomicrobiales bacterium]
MNGSAAEGAARISARLRELYAVSDDPGGLTRLTLSPSHKRAVDLVSRWMQEAGLATRLDPTGTVVGRREGPNASAKTLLIGSHIDSVRNGGMFDGPLGVVLAIEVLRRLGNLGRKLPFAVEVLAFGDEEGVRFPTALTGSRAAAGTFDPAALDSRDAAGVSRRDALTAFGCDPAWIAAEARDPARTLGYLEVHIEQGPVLETRGLPLGVVTAINGASRGEIVIKGVAGHSGTIPMHMRHDAAAAGAQALLAIEDVGRSFEDLVATVGRFDIPNGAVNVVPGAARLSVDVRSPSDRDRALALKAIRTRVQAIAQQRGVTADLAITYDMPAAPCDPALMQRFERAFARQGYEPFRLPSGAGHDAMAFRGRIPIAMLFVRCRGGVSHRPDEFASDADIACALAVMEDYVETFAARA